MASNGGRGGVSRTLIEPELGGAEGERRAVRLALEIYLDMLPETSADLYASVVRDARLDADDRLELLREGLVRLSLPAPLGSPVEPLVATAIEWGRSAAEPEIRARVWQAVGGVMEPSVSRALIDALSSDRDARVRSAAARALRSRSVDADVRAVLERAAAVDSSAVVRLEARWITMSDVERRALLESLSSDASVPAEQRMAVLLLAHETSPAVFDAVAARDAAATALLAEAVRSNADSETALRALLALAGNPALVEPLLSNLDDPDAGVRRIAIRALLNGYRDVPGVLDAVQRAYAREPEPALRYAVDRALATP